MRYFIHYRGNGRKFELTGQLHCGRLRQRQGSHRIHAAIALEAGGQVILDPHAVVTDCDGNVVFMGCSAIDQQRELRRMMRDMADLIPQTYGYTW